MISELVFLRLISLEILEKLIFSLSALLPEAQNDIFRSYEFRIFVFLLLIDLNNLYTYSEKVKENYYNLVD